MVTEDFRYPLTSPISPHWGRPAGSDKAEVTTRQDAWKCLYQQVRDEIDRPDWRHAASTGNGHEIFAETSQEVAHCECTLYVPPRIKGDFAQLHHVVVPRRMERHSWTSDLAPNPGRKIRG